MLQIARFWELQGSSLKIQVVDKKALNLFCLHKIVVEEGGMDHVTRESHWTVIATRMGLKSIHNKRIGGILRNHYERATHAQSTMHFNTRGDEEATLLCDGCDDSCLTPPLNKGDWRCPCCVAEEVSKPVEAFGFEQVNLFFYF